MGRFSFLNIFKKREKVQKIDSSINVDIMQGFLGQIDDLVCITDRDGKIEYINDAEKRAQIGTLQELLNFKENKILYNKIISTAIEEGSYIGDIEIEKYDKKKNFYIACYYTQIKNKFVVFIKDMDKYVRHEENLRREIIKQNECINATKLLLANISHEIRTPLNIIVGMIYFLKSTKLDVAQLEYINKLERSSNVLLEIVQGMLDVTNKTDNATIRFEKSVFNLKEFIDNFVEVFKEQILDKKIQWYFTPGFDIDVDVYADKARVSQIFINLISNAIKYTEKGYIELEVEKTTETKELYQLRFCLKDTGIGIKKEDSVKIFKEFEQVEDVYTKEKEGKGMGLAIAKKIVENMNGKIWLESNYGLGTKFYFTITLEKATEQMKDAKKEKLIIENVNNIENIEISENIQLKDVKILLVENDLTNSEIAKKVLEEINIEVDVVENGVEAITQIEKMGPKYYDLILMDIHMPKHDGYEIAQILKKQLSLETKIVAYTATNITNEIIAENQNYIYDYIQKPILPPDLKKRVMDLIKETKSKQAFTYAEKPRILILGSDNKNISEIQEGLQERYDTIVVNSINNLQILIESIIVDALIIDELSEEKEYFNIVETLKKNEKTRNIPIIVVGKKKQEDKKNTEEALAELNINEIIIEEEYNFDNISWNINRIISQSGKEQDLIEDLEQTKYEKENAYDFLYKSLVDLTSLKSKETGSHLLRTKLYMIDFLSNYEKLYQEGTFTDKKTVEEIAIAATLHDIGKVGIPDSILNKPGKLTDEEYELMKKHAEIGANILENEFAEKINNNTLEYAREIAMNHHEKYDGTGYPNQLKKDEINIISQIMSVIDVYDALVNDRVYKKAMPYEEAEAYIISQNEKAFSPKIINIFLLVKNNLKEINEKYKDKI